MAYVGHRLALPYFGGLEGERETCGDASGLQRATGTFGFHVKKETLVHVRASVFLPSSMIKLYADRKITMALSGGQGRS